MKSTHYARVMARFFQHTIRVCFRYWFTAPLDAYYSILNYLVALLRLTFQIFYHYTFITLSLSLSSFPLINMPLYFSPSLPILIPLSCNAHLSPFTSHISPLTRHLSFFIFHLSPFTFQSCWFSCSLALYPQNLTLLYNSHICSLGSNWKSVHVA